MGLKLKMRSSLKSKHTMPEGSFCGMLPVFVLGILAVTCFLWPLEAGAARNNNIYVMVESSDRGVENICPIGDNFYVTTRGVSAPDFGAVITFSALSPFYLVKPEREMLLLGIGESDEYGVRSESGAEDPPNGMVQVLKLDIVPTVTNVNWNSKSCRLSLTRDSYPGGTAVWSSVPEGISGRGNAITFNPNSLDPGEYVVTARSGIVSTYFDKCTVRVIKVKITGFEKTPIVARGDECAEKDHQSKCLCEVLPEGISNVSYSIEGAKHGATIDPKTGEITPGIKDSGIVRIRATSGLSPDCFDEKEITIEAIPVGISCTSIVQTGLQYGAIFQHTAKSSGGSLIKRKITEVVTVLTDDFNFGWDGWDEGIGTIQLNAKGEFEDRIKTNSRLVDVNDFMPSPPKKGLPAFFCTPQQLKWRCPMCEKWRLFASVSIEAKLDHDGSGFIFVTTSNGQTVKEAYTGNPYH